MAVWGVASTSTYALDAAIRAGRSAPAATGIRAATGAAAATAAAAAPAGFAAAAGEPRLGVQLLAFAESAGGSRRGAAAATAAGAAPAGWEAAAGEPPLGVQLLAFADSAGASAAGAVGAAGGSSGGGDSVSRTQQEEEQQAQTGGQQETDRQQVAAAPLHVRMGLASDAIWLQLPGGAEHADVAAAATRVVESVVLAGGVAPGDVQVCVRRWAARKYRLQLRVEPLALAVQAMAPASQQYTD